MNINEKKAENSPAGGVLVGKKDGQTIIHDEGTMSGYLVGKLHKDGGIKAVNKATGQPLEMQGGEVVITAPAVSDQTKREFEGKMMTNREILSAINEKGGGVSFAKGGDIPKSFKTSGASYKYGGKTMKDHEILKVMNGSGHLSKGKSLKQIAEMHNVSLAHINKELEKGLEVEKEHFTDFKERTRVAKDHLVENPNYYSILAKAGLKHGGHLNSHHIPKENLVKDAKSGNTPARDLNNYNDIMDLEADGAVGGDSGLAFADGGEIKDIEPYFERFNRIGLSGVDNVMKSQVDFMDFERYLDSAQRGIENKYVGYEKFPFHEFVKKYDYVTKKDYYYSNQEHKAEIDLLVEKLKKEGYTVLTKTYSFTKGASQGFNKNNKAINVFAFKLKSFADGGGVELPKVAYVTIENAGTSLNNLIGNKYRSYIEFVISVEYAYKQLSKKIRTFVSLYAYDENDSKLISVNTYVSDQKNTVKNFNPFTGNYKNLEKSLSNSRPVSFKKYNWEDWFQSKVKPKSVSKSTQKEYPEYYEFIDETQIYDGITRFTKNKIYKIINPKDIEDSHNFIDDRGIGNGYGSNNPKKFKPSTKEAYEAQEGIVSEVSELKYPKYYEYIGGSNEGFTKSKIYKIANPKNLADTKNFLNNKGEFDGYAENNYKYFTPSTREAYEASEAKFDFSNTKINVKDNSVLSLRVQQKAFDSGWEWEKGAGGGKVLNFDWFNYLYFTKTSISYGNSYESFKNSPKKEITEQDIFGIKPKEESTQESTQEGTFEVKEGDYLTRRWLKCVKKNDWSSDIGRPNVGDYLKIVDVSIVSLKGTINVTNKIGGNEKLSIDRITKQKEFQLMPEGFSPEQVKETTKAQESIQEGTFEIKVGDDLTGRWLKLVKKTNWSSYKRRPKIGDYLKILNGKIISLTSTISVSNKGDDEELSIERILKKEFQVMPEGFSPEKVKETKTLKLSNLKKGDRFTFELTQTDIDIEFTKVMKDNIIYVFDSNVYVSDLGKEKSTYYYKSGDDIFNTSTNYNVNLVEIEKTIEVKPTRNFELERKYFHRRIAELSKELDLKRPILSNEETGFYQREINNLIFKLRKLNEEQQSLIPINERLEKVFSLKFGDFDKEYIETDLTSPNGVKSELTEEEYFAVRTEGFKSFFGDWMLAIENNNYNAISKIINPKTKEPLAVWHGTNVLFTEWKTYQTNNAHYFAVKKEMSEFFAKSWESRTDKAAVDSKALKTLNPNKGKYLLKCFLDIKNPVDFSRFGVEKRPVKEFLLFLKINYNIGDYDFWTKAGNMFGLAPDAKVYAWQIIRNWQAFTQYIKTFTTYDGYIFYEYIPDKEFSGIENASLSFCAFESNQIKFDNAVEFNALANDSRFNLGGKI